MVSIEDSVFIIINIICSEGGNDVIFSDDGVDAIFANGGQDTVQGGLGNNQIFGGDEVDTLVVDLTDPILRAKTAEKRHLTVIV